MLSSKGWMSSYKALKVMRMQDQNQNQNQNQNHIPNLYTEVLEENWSANRMSVVII